MYLWYKNRYDRDGTPSAFKPHAARNTDNMTIL